jgi:ATP-dependent 26S proteasome regulatory subunit
MMVEKVPDSTYEMVGGLDKQIKEIKEVDCMLSWKQSIVCDTVKTACSVYTCSTP